MNQFIHSKKKSKQCKIVIWLTIALPDSNGKVKNVEHLDYAQRLCKPVKISIPLSRLHGIYYYYY
jgi:hypothetical protein